MTIENRDYELIIDKSGSMETTDCKGKSRWDAAKETTIAFAYKMSKLDPDGITIYTFANSFKRYDNVTPDKVEQIFKENEPGGGTDLGGVLKDSLSKYFERKTSGTSKPTTMIVITDGEPNDKNHVVNEIISAANKIDVDEELTLSFIQIGSDSAAGAFLKSLDDDLQAKGAKFDIVDTKTFEEVENVGITETLLAAIND